VGGVRINSQATGRHVMEFGSAVFPSVCVITSGTSSVGFGGVCAPLCIL